MIKKFLSLILVLPLLCYSCKDDEPVNWDDSREEESSEDNLEITDDFLNGKIFYVHTLSDFLAGDIVLNTKDSVDFYAYPNNMAELKVIDRKGYQVLTIETLEGYKGGRLILPAYAQSRKNRRIRNVIIIVEPDETKSEEGEEEIDFDSAMSPLFPRFGQFLGMGTKSFLELGNNTRQVFLFDKLPIGDGNLFTSRTFTKIDMDEIHEHSFEEVMTSWSLNVGLSASKGGFSGTFNFGFSSSNRNSRDFEYYMCYLKIARAEMKINREELKRMVNRDNRSAMNLVGYFSKGFRESIMETVLNEEKANNFLNDWGTDVITQGTLGGQAHMIFSREETISEHKIGTSISACVSHKKDFEKDTSMGEWYNIFLMKSHDDDFKSSVSFEFQKSEYIQSSKSELKYNATGGSASLNADKWMKAFEEKEDYDKWDIIDFRTGSDDSKAPLWLLCPMEEMGLNLVDAVETIFKAYKNYSKYDKVIISNARKNLTILAEERKKYIEKNIILEAKETPLILADVMMVNSPDRRKKNQPQPFVKPYDRNPEILLTYYPMITSKFPNIKSKGLHKLSGKPIDTNDDCFVASGHTTSHYWYYAYVHDSPDVGITDIQFLTEDEANNNPEYQNYYKRGDHARHGLSGLLVKERYVYVKYFDKNKDNPKFKITGFGLFDSNSCFKGKEPWQRVIAATGGVDWLPFYLESESDLFKDYWNYQKEDDGAYFVIGKNQFYKGGGVIPHSIYPISSFVPLPKDSIDKLPKGTLLTW